MAEFVCDDALQFVAVQEFQRATRDRNRGIARCKAGGERVNCGFFFQNINLRNGHAGCDRHLLDDVPEPASQRVLDVCRNLGATHLLSNATAAR